MNNIKKFFTNYAVQLGLFFILALFLILVSVIFLEDIKAPSDILVYNIFGTLGIAGFLHSFQLANKKLWLYLAIGKTRKQVYYQYLGRIVLSLGLSLFLVGYYILIFKLYVNQYFDYSKMFFLPLVSITLALVGFLIGLLRVKHLWVNIGLGLAICGLTLIIYFLEIVYYWDILLLVLAGALAGFNYYLVKHKNIEG
jgi:hypothetical protein